MLANSPAPACPAAPRPAFLASRNRPFSPFVRPTFPRPAFQPATPFFSANQPPIVRRRRGEVYAIARQISPGVFAPVFRPDSRAVFCADSRPVFCASVPGGFRAAFRANLAQRIAAVFVHLAPAVFARVTAYGSKPVSLRDFARAVWQWSAEPAAPVSVQSAIVRCAAGALAGLAIVALLSILPV